MMLQPPCVGVREQNITGGRGEGGGERERERSEGGRREAGTGTVCPTSLVAVKLRAARRGSCGARCAHRGRRSSLRARPR